MEREPSIHITLSKAKEILKSMGIKLDWEQFMLECKKYSLDNRSVTITNARLQKNITNILKSTKGDASLMADIIYATRIKLKHRGVRRINPDSREWAQVKELAQLGNQFCSEFELDTRSGFIKYIELGLGKMTSFRGYLSKLINMYETICREYEAELNMKEDDNPVGTLELHDLFVNKIADRTGIMEGFQNKPDKMLAFAMARKLCDDLGVDYETFIDAQFEALDWCNGIPTPETLYGDKAKERLNKYLYQSNITINKPKVKDDFWSSLKH